MVAFSCFEDRVYSTLEIQKSRCKQLRKESNNDENHSSHSNRKLWSKDTNKSCNRRTSGFRINIGLSSWLNFIYWQNDRQTHTQTRTYTRTNTIKAACVTYTFIYERTCIHKSPQTCTHIHIYTHTQLHTHTDKLKWL